MSVLRMHFNNNKTKIEKFDHQYEIACNTEVSLRLMYLFVVTTNNFFFAIKRQSWRMPLQSWPRLFFSSKSLLPFASKTKQLHWPSDGKIKQGQHFRQWSYFVPPSTSKWSCFVLPAKGRLASSFRCVTSFLILLEHVFVISGWPRRRRPVVVFDSHFQLTVLNQIICIYCLWCEW